MFNNCLIRDYSLKVALGFGAYQHKNSQIFVLKNKQLISYINVINTCFDQ